MVAARWEPGQVVWIFNNISCLLAAAFPVDPFNSGDVNTRDGLGNAQHLLPPPSFFILYISLYMTKYDIICAVFEQIYIGMHNSKETPRLAQGGAAGKVMPHSVRTLGLILILGAGCVEFAGFLYWLGEFPWVHGVCHGIFVLAGCFILEQTARVGCSFRGNQN